MSTKSLRRGKRARLLALLALIVLPLATQAADDQEAKIGKQVYEELQKKGEIIKSSPDYAVLMPIAAQIKRIADPQYAYPFHFILVHEAQPNAFAVPGGNVYVTDSLMKFVKNREELAGVLCHETSHDIHHDVINNMRKDQNLSYAAAALSMLLGQAAGGIAGTAIGYAANIQALTYSRAVETQADLKGAQTCAQAGSNPWGMVWLFTQFEKADTGGHMEMLSDHPTDGRRIENLRNEFQSDPALFGRFSSSIEHATPLRTHQKRYITDQHRPYTETPQPSKTSDDDDAPPTRPVPAATPRPGYGRYGPLDNDVPRF